MISKIKKISLLLAMFTLAFVFSLCEKQDAKAACSHQYVKQATCTTIKKCNMCGAKLGDALGHSYAAATCSSPQKCKRSGCSATTGSPLGHNWKSATCTSAKKCSRCGTTSGSSLGHSWNAATCTTPKKCSRCKTTSGDKLGHSWSPATCNAPKTCKRCHTTSGEKRGHNYSPATCTTPKTCQYCKTTSGKALGHNWKDATCTEPKTCYRCKTKTGSAAGHKGSTRTCTAPSICSVCKATVAPALGHDWAAATCSAPKTCKRYGCGQKTGTALGHDGKATCTKDGICSRCGVHNQKAFGHKGTTATCTAASICTVCKATVAPALNHDWAAATCYAPKTCKRYGCGAQQGSVQHNMQPATYTTKSKCSNCGYSTGKTLPITVSFNCYGANGAGSVKPITVYYHETYNYLPASPTLTGYKFVGWFTDATGGTKVTTSTLVTKGGPHTLFAHWMVDEKDIYTINFNLNGGKGSSAESFGSIYKKNHESVQLPVQIPQKDGFVFMGWSLENDGLWNYREGTVISSNEMFGTNGSRTLYAVWTEQPNNYIKSVLQNTYGKGHFSDERFCSPYAPSTWEQLNPSTYFIMKTYSYQYYNRTMWSTSVFIISNNGEKYILTEYTDNTTPGNAIKNYIAENNKNAVATTLLSAYVVLDNFVNDVISYVIPGTSTVVSLSSDFVDCINNYIDSHPNDERIRNLYSMGFKNFREFALWYLDSKNIGDKIEKYKIPEVLSVLDFFFEISSIHINSKLARQEQYDPFGSYDVAIKQFCDNISAKGYSSSVINDLRTRVINSINY